MFFFWNIINVGTSIITIYITIIAIENGNVIPSNVGIPPQKYSVKFQFGVTKYLIQFSFKFKASIFITELPIYPNNEIVIANAEFVNIVLNANARVISKIYIGAFPSACIAKYCIVFICFTLFIVWS